jgi:hypothetical protein
LKEPLSAPAHFLAFSRRVLTDLPLLENSDDFVFDNEMLAQIIGKVQKLWHRVFVNKQLRDRDNRFSSASNAFQ